MPDKPVDIQYKEYANNIVGTWYNRIPDEVLTFSLLNELTEEADLLTQHNGVEDKSTYSLATTYNDRWYLQIWGTDNNKHGVYRIEILTATILTLCSNEHRITTYQRKVDYAFANELLSTLI